MAQPGEKLSEERLQKLREAGRLGGFAKRGTMSLRKVNEMKKKTAIKQRILAMADKLLNAEMVAAMGTHRMVVIDTDEDGKKHLTTIRDEARMDILLETGEYGIDYLIIAGAEPDWKAAEALLTRALGKPRETLDINHNVFSLMELAKTRKGLDALPAPTPVPFTELKAP